MARVSKSDASTGVATEEKTDDLDVAFADNLAAKPAVETPVETVKAPRRFEITPERIKRLTKSQIVMEKADPSKRSFSKEFAEKLAASITNEGLIHPPLVVDNGNGTYTVKAGKHRSYACFKILGWETMPCFVLEPGEDDLAESIELSTNIWVNPLSEPQFRSAVRRWWEIYASRHPKKENLRGEESKHDGFAKEVSIALGISKSQGHRIAATAKAISAEDRNTLESSGVTQTKIDEISKLKDPEAIQTAVNLTAAGKDTDEAIRAAKKFKKDKEKKTEKLAGTPPAAPDKRAKKAELTDDEWLDVHCGKLIAVLPYKTAFRRDAILYRRISDKMISFRTATKKALVEAKKPGENGAFFANVFRIIRCSHPMNWFICDGCNGAGHIADDKSKQCNKCLGGGYKMSFEET